jgi:hypothetical protein
MTAIALKPFQADFRKLILVMLMIALLAFGLGVIFSSLLMKTSGVPLNPCKTCGSACGCPRMSGSIRCGCAQ